MGPASVPLAANEKNVLAEEGPVFVLFVLLMFAVPYVVSPFRKREGEPSKPPQAEGLEFVNQARVSTISTNETAASSAAVLYRSA